jgi:hypothetical protein
MRRKSLTHLEKDHYYVSEARSDSKRFINYIIVILSKEIQDMNQKQQLN